MCETTTILPTAKTEVKGNSELSIQSLGIYTINFGTSGDPDRIKKMVGNVFNDFFQNYLDDNLDPNRFNRNGDGYTRGIDNWPEESQKVELLALCFNENLPDRDFVFLEKLPRFYSEYPDLHLGSFPQLATQSSDIKLIELMRLGISHLAAIDDDSLRLNGDGQECNAFVFSGSWYSGLSSHRTNEPYDKITHFLVYRKL